MNWTVLKTRHQRLLRELGSHTVTVMFDSGAKVTGQVCQDEPPHLWNEYEMVLISASRSGRKRHFVATDSIAVITVKES